MPSLFSVLDRHSGSFFFFLHTEASNAEWQPSKKGRTTVRVERRIQVAKRDEDKMAVAASAGTMAEAGSSASIWLS